MFLREHLGREEGRLSPFWQERKSLGIKNILLTIKYKTVSEGDLPCSLLIKKDKKLFVSGKGMNVGTFAIMLLVALRTFKAL